MTRNTKPATADGFVRGSRNDRSLAKRSAVLLAGVFLASLLAVSLLGENGLGAWFHLHADRAGLEQDVVELEVDNADLGQRLGALAKDPEFFEKLLREDFHGQRPGEEVLLLVPDDSEAREAHESRRD